MKTINHEYYVSLEIAKLLKEAGFDWECRFAFLPTIEMGETPYAYFHNPANYNDKIKHPYEIYSSPTLDVAQRWLREVKKIHIEITFGGKWIYTPYNLTNLECLLSEDEFPETRNYNTYEEAQETGIKKVLKLILKKENKL